MLKPCFEGVLTSCTAKSQLSYVQLFRNIVKEGKEMEKEFLNITKSGVNLKNYANINLFYNYEMKHSIYFTESQQEVMFLIQSSELSTETCETLIQYHDISKHSTWR